MQPRVFHDAAEADGRPKLILLGGQPGGGTTKAVSQILCSGDYRHVTRLIADDHRRFHPDYRDVLDREPLAMPDVTAQAVGEWLRLAVNHALETRYSILIEGTWRNAGVPMKTIGLGGRPRGRHRLQGEARPRWQGR